MASSLLATQQQQRGAAASCAAAPGRRALGCSFSAAAPRLTAPRRSPLLHVLNTASGSRGSSSQQQPQSPQLRRPTPVKPAKPGSPLSTAARRASAARAVVSSTTDSLSRLLTRLAGPTLMASLAGGLLMGAAALHHGDGGAAAEHANAAASAASAIAGGSLYPAREFGPADFVDTAFGPTRPVWALLLHSHHYAAVAAASSVAKHADVVTAAAAQHLPHLPHLPDLSGAGGGVSASGSLVAPSSASELWAQARGAALEAAGHVSEAAHGAVAQTVDGYNAWLEESPLLCKIVTGNFFTIAGDMLAQLGCAGGGGGHGAPEASADASAATATAAAGGRRHVNWARTTRLCLETSLVGTPMAHYWFNLLDARVLPDDPHCPAAVLTKMLLDQLLFAPLGLALFFVVIKLLEGRPADIRRSLQTSYVKSLLGGYLLWPAAGLLNFALLPNEYRLLFNNCVNIIWTCFLSVMSSSDDSTESASTAAASPTPAVTVAATAAAASSPALDTAAGPSSTASGFMTGAQDLAAAAVTAAALGAAVHGNRPAFGAVAGLAVAVVEATCSTAASAVAAAVVASEEPHQQSSPATSGSSGAVDETRLFAGGGSVLVGGPCLEVCEPERDETTR
ncbi:hypothetical protein HYH02_008459 [Chlamydomonas schloesseri]|uniref:Uncharacterized protein n=1 Tax=Chlamydomonas schloesseri TaxID=2026947 RepID=A0A836B3N6_9CHLO|nr:hypothetical protein HYH02_008459 [Chlamydomonas schloesseri]|eukprot:KAG2446468.1 hypothetical protein HYH02_008459 [Chlamydomonas schloesseri]